MVEETILHNLVFNEQFCRKAIPFIKPEYFQDSGQRLLFTIINNHVQKYNAMPTKQALNIELNSISGINENEFKSAQQTIEHVDQTGAETEAKLDWLLDTAEKFCQDKAIYNGIMESIQILDDKSGKLQKGAIPKILSDALGVSFDQSIGHDFFGDYVSRYKYYHSIEERVPLDIEMLNIITNGGFPKKTLNIILAGPHVGKSLFMCHCASGNLVLGKNVLYITMEMAEEEISKRIDANLLNVTMDELMVLSEDVYQKKMQRVREKTIGQLVVKEYPSATVSAQNFRNLLNDLKLKKNFVPDIIYIDYLNICTSSRIKMGSNVNTYTYIKSIAEELRGLASEFDVPIVSATQTTRGGFTSSDLGLEDTSESFGLPATADFMIALIATEELTELGQMLCKQLKNRYKDLALHRRFIVGVDKSKMRLYDVEQSAQNDLLEDGPIFDSSDSGRKIKDREKKSKFNKTEGNVLDF